MRRTLSQYGRYLARALVAKHQFYVWVVTEILPANLVIVFGRDDDYFFGVVQSRIHAAWASVKGTQLRERESGFRYTPTTCFETFPFPKPSDSQLQEIGKAANALDQLRSNWLNPPEWTTTEVLEFPGSTDGPWAKYIYKPNKDGIGTVRYPRTVAKNADCAEKLKQQTLTNLYNERPTWLDNAHKKLDAAVCDAYGWPTGISDEEILEKLLALNLERAGS